MRGKARWSHRIRRGPGRSLSDERGQALIEFALASIVFFITVFGTLEFGLAIYRYNMVADLAQEGARWAAVRGSSSGGLAASAADLQAFVQSRSPGFTVTVTAIPAAPSAASPGSIIDVTVSATFAPVTNLIPAATLNLQGRAKMTVFR